MDSFGIFLYFNLKTEQASDFELLASSLYKELDQLHIHISSAFELHQKEYKKSKKSLSEQYEPMIREAYVSFEKLLQEGTERSLAGHLSNYDELENYNGFSEHEIENNFLEIKDIYIKSFLVTIYAFVEHNLYKICDYCQKKWNLKIKRTDLNGENYIDIVKKYLIFVVEISDIEIKPPFTKIDEYCHLRNSIVHNGSCIDPVKVKAMEKFLQIDAENRFFKIEKEKILYNFIDLANNLFKQVFFTIEKEKFNFKNLEGRIEGFIKSFPKVTNINFSPLKEIQNSSIKIEGKLSFDNLLSEHSLKIAISKKSSKKSSKIEIFNQLDESEDAIFLKNHIETYSHYLFECIDPFLYFINKSYTIKVMLH